MWGLLIAYNLVRLEMSPIASERSPSDDFLATTAPSRLVQTMRIACMVLATGCVLDTSATEQGAVTGIDDRVLLDAAALAGSPLRAVGAISGCTATKIDAEYVVTASHCFWQKHPDPSQTTFYPARVPGQPSSSIGIRRIILGTQGLSKPCTQASDCSSGNCTNGVCNYFEGGADFALLQVDPATFQANGSTLTPTWDAVPAAELVIQAAPPPTGGIPVTAIGYSWDLMGYAGMHENCVLLDRVTAYPGMFDSACDWRSGASGGPLFRYGTTQLTALVSGDSWVADTHPPYWIPRDPRGVTAVRNADGRVHAYASDRSSGNQMMLRAQTTTAGYYPTTFDAWRDVRGGMAVPDPGRASSVLFDQRQFVFMVGSDRRVYANIQVVPSGNLTGWQGFFHGDPEAEMVIDIASDASSNVLFQYLATRTGLVLKRKIGNHASGWQPWQLLVPGNKIGMVAANNTQGFPVAMFGHAGVVYITWASDLAGTAWVPPQDFGELGLRGGLPRGACIGDLELGRTIDDRLDAFVLLYEECRLERPAIWRRTKTTNIAGSAWGSWYAYRTLADSFDVPRVPLNIPNPQLAGASALGLLPADPARGDGLLIISRGNLYASFWGSATTYEGWAPFYGPVRPW